MTPLCSTCADTLLCAHGNIKTKTLTDGTIVSYAFEYSDKTVANIIHRVKFNNQPWWLTYLACARKELHDAIETTGTYLCPVPLHAHRKNERGYNQAESLTRAFVKHNRIYDGVVRIKNTKAQSTIETHDKRFKNIENAFCIAKPLPKNCRNVILVDDVCTTGATLMELRACFPKNVLVSAITLCG